MTTPLPTRTVTPRAGKNKGPAVPAWSLTVPFAVLLLLAIIALQKPDGRLHVWVLDVGQGDAIIVETPRGHVALIDGGPGATPVLNGLGAHVPFWRHDIDLIALTHPHQDHLMGLIDVLAHYKVGQVIQTAFTGTTGIEGEWLNALARRDVPVHYARRGELITFAGEPDVALHVLSPTTPEAGQELKGGDLNNTSIVIKLDYGKQGILLEGDAQTAAESEMVRAEAPALKSRVLKVGHHGSDTSSGIPFLSSVKPQIAIISVGAGNRYKHPAPQTLDALRGSGARVYRTDLNGTTEIIADKEHLWVRSER